MNPAGAQKVAFDLAANLDKKKYHVLICSLKGGTLAAKAREEGIEVSILQPHFPRDPRALWKLTSLVKERNIDLLNSHDFEASLYGYMATYLARKPRFAVTEHGMYRYVLKKRKRLLANKLLTRRADAVIAVSEATRKDIQGLVGGSPGKIKVIHNGILLPRIDSNSDKAGKRRELGLSTDVPVIGTVGNFRPQKAHDCFLKAAYKVLQDIPTAKFLIVGEGPLKADIEALAKELGIFQSTIFTGRRVDVPELLQIMDVFVLSSVWEGISIALGEAMASAKPVVITNVGGNSEMVNDGENGFLVPPRNPLALARSIVRVLRDKELAARMGMAARKRIDDEFSMSAMISKVEQLYEKLMN